MRERRPPVLRRDEALTPSSAPAAAAARDSRMPEARTRSEGALAPPPAAAYDDLRTHTTRQQFRPRRMAKFDYTGRYAYHLVVVTSGREPVLVGDLAAQTVIDLERAAGAADFELLAYVVMPDHVHVLALGVSDGAVATKFMQRFKQFSGYRYKQHAGCPLWQWSFFDHTLRGEEDLIAVARYIVGNPVRAGLTSLEGEWLYQGGTLISGAEAPSLQPGGAKAPSLHPSGDAVPPASTPTTRLQTGDTQ